MCSCTKTYPCLQPACLSCARRLPLEAESAALGAALQAAACHQGVPVGEFVAQHPPPLSDEVGYTRIPPMMGQQASMLPCQDKKPLRLCPTLAQALAPTLCPCFLTLALPLHCLPAGDPA